MAITINSTPDAMNAAYSPINWNVTSNDANIKAIRADVYINGNYSTTLNAVQQLGTTDTFDLDIQKIMQSQLVSELRYNITSLAITSAIISACSVKVRFYEVVLSGGVYTTTWAEDGAGTGYEESSTYNVTNTAIQENEDLTDYTVSSSSKKFLTMRTSNCRIPRGVPFQIGFLSAINLSFIIKRLDEDLNVLTSAQSGFNTATYGKGIIEIPESYFSSASYSYLDIYLIDAGDAIRSETIRYKIEDACMLYPVFIQNHLGDFDHFNFGGHKIKNINTKNQSIKKPLPAPPFKSYYAGNIIVQSNVNERLKVETESLSAVELTFLEEFIKNHSVTYYWEAANTFRRRKISSHSTKTVDNDSLINTLSLTFEPSNSHKVQKGD